MAWEGVGGEFWFCPNRSYLISKSGQYSDDPLLPPLPPPSPLPSLAVPIFFSFPLNPVRNDCPPSPVIPQNPLSPSPEAIKNFQVVVVPLIIKCTVQA